MDKDFCMFNAFLREFLAFLMHIWYYLAYFYRKLKKKIKKYLQKIIKKDITKFEMLIRAGGEDGQPMWITFKIYNIIIKSSKVDKGGG